MSTRWAALAAVIIILASSLCIPMAANGSDGDVATGSQNNPLSSLSTSTASAEGKTFYVTSGGTVSITATGELIVDSVTSGYGLTVSQTNLSGTLSKSGTVTVTCLYIHSDQTTTFTIISVANGGTVQTGSQANPLSSLSVSAANALDKTFYVSVGGAVSITGHVTYWDLSSTAGLGVTSGYGLSVQQSGDYENVVGTITRAGTTTVTAAVETSDNVHTITIVGVGSGTVSYTVTLNANDGKVNGQDSITLTYTGSGLTLPDATRSGYRFTGWYTSGTAVTPAPNPYTPTNNVTLYARWDPIFTIYLNATGGTVSPSTMTYDGTQALTLPTPTKSGYTFDGWYTQQTGGDEATSPYTPTGSRTLYAHWTESQSGGQSGGQSGTTHRVDLVANPTDGGAFYYGGGSGGMVAATSLTVADGEIVEFDSIGRLNIKDTNDNITQYIIVNPNGSNQLVGWSVDWVGYIPDEFTVNEDLTLIATFVDLNGRVGISAPVNISAERGSTGNTFNVMVLPSDSTLTVSGPSGWNVSANNGTITFDVPANTPVDDYAITLTGIKASYGHGEATVTVHVTAPATPEVTITAPGIVSAEKGSQNNSFNISTTPSGAILTITMPSGWGTATVSNGKLTYSVPANATPGNTYRIQITATATGYSNGSAEVQVRVTEPAALDPVGINVSNSVSAVKGSTGNTISFTTTPSDATVTATGPSGWSFSVSGGNITYSVASSAAPGDYTINLTASKTGYEAGHATVTVHVANVLQFTNNPSASCTIVGASS